MRNHKTFSLLYIGTSTQNLYSYILKFADFASSWKFFLTKVFVCFVLGENLVPKPADEVEAQQEGAAGGQGQGRRRQARRRRRQGEPLESVGHGGGQGGGRHDGPGGGRLEQLQQQLPRRRRPLAAASAAPASEFGDAAGGAAAPRPGGGPPPPAPPPPPTRSAPRLGRGPLPTLRRVTRGGLRRHLQPDLTIFLFVALCRVTLRRKCGKDEPQGTVFSSPISGAIFKLNNSQNS